MQRDRKRIGDIARAGVLAVHEDAVPVPERLRWLAELPGGSDWLSTIGKLVSGCVRDWRLTLHAPLPRGNVSWVAHAELPDGTPATLKLSFPDSEARHEADALSFWAGRGAVRLHKHDRARHALLLARCDPGAPLWSIEDDDAANRIAAGVLRCLRRPPPTAAPFRALDDEAGRWAAELPQRYKHHGEPFPRRLVEQAVTLCSELADTQPTVVVCHQDLHGGNVLSVGKNGWVAIDPKPLLGEPAFDVASLLRDRRDWLLSCANPRVVVRRRLDLLSSELDLDRDRARGWGIVHALAWGLTDQHVYSPNIACAQLLSAC